MWTNLQISTRGELLGATLQLADEGLLLPVDRGLVRPDVTTLRECPATHGTLVRSFSGVCTLVSLAHEEVRDLVV